MVEGKALPTIWDVPDDLWERIGPVILELDPPKARGRKRADQRKMLEGIIFRMRSSCQWNHLPRELGDDSAIHRTFQHWVGCWRASGLPWWRVARNWAEWTGNGQSADCSMGKARLGGGAIGRNPTGRGKAGSKKSILVDAAGGPLSVAVAGANVHDTKLLRPTLENIVVARPEGVRNLCLDKRYDNPTGHETVAAFRYCRHIRRIGEEKLDQWGEKMG